LLIEQNQRLIQGGLEQKKPSSSKPKLLHMKTTIALAMLFCVSSLCTQAQIVDRTKEKAENKTNNRIDNRIDKGIDKGLDSIENLFKKKNKKKKGSDSEKSNESNNQDQTNSAGENSMDMGAFFGGGGSIEPSYEFQHAVHVDISSSDKKGETFDQDMIMYSNDEGGQGAFVMSMEQEGAQESVAIFDFEKKQMITLVDASGMKMAMVMKMDPAAYQSDEETTSTEDTPEYTKTGRSKEILGYTCDEYLMEDEEQSTQLWMSREVVVDLFQAFSAYAMQNEKQSAPSPQTEMSGTMMEMTSTSKKHSKEKTTWKVTKIEKDVDTSISTEGYSVMGG
jgi:hypothetical protein